MKVCTQCLVEQPLTEYYKDSRKPGKLRAYCKTCHSQYHKKRRETHGEHMRQQSNESYERNKEKYYPRKRKHFAENKPRYKAWATTWREENPELMRIYTSNYRQKKVGLPSTLTIDEWQETLKYFGYCCAYCLKHEDEVGKMQQEHMQPVSKGGGYTKENIVPACSSCNQSKGNKILLQWVGY